MPWRLTIALVLALQGASSSRTPVVVELFTSEGCSSCPPADALLTKLMKDQPVAGVQIIPLGMHVTYWDQLGWKDPASLNAATERQQGYSAVFGPDRVYTPQAVVDGRDELVGSDEDGLRRAIARAAARPHLRPELKAALTGDGLSAEVAFPGGLPNADEPLHAWLVLTEDGLTSIVKRGENGGRTLHNDAVVRHVTGGAIGNASPLKYTVQLRPEWRRAGLHVTVLVQGRRTHRIYGAATTAVG